MKRVCCAVDLRLLLKCIIRIFQLCVSISWRNTLPRILRWWHGTNTLNRLSKWAPLFPEKFTPIGIPAFYETWSFITVYTKFCHYIFLTLIQPQLYTPFLSDFNIILVVFAFLSKIGFYDEILVQNTLCTSNVLRTCPLISLSIINYHRTVGHFLHLHLFFLLRHLPSLLLTLCIAGPCSRFVFVCNARTLVLFSISEN